MDILRTLLNALPSIISGVIVWLLKKHFDKKDSEREAQLKQKEDEAKALIERLKTSEDGIKALLHDRLYQATSYYRKKGYCSMEDKENLETMAKPYIAMGMNGTVKAGNEICQHLPNDPPGRRRNEIA